MIEASAIQTAVEALGGRLITGVTVGMLLAILAAVILRVTKSSSTRFAISFLTLLAIAIFPLAACFVTVRSASVDYASPISVPGAWASASVFFWIAGAMIGLFRIAVGLWRVRRIRQRCIDLDPNVLTSAAVSVELKRTLEECGKPRRVSLCISQDLSVPAATGFFKPAVILPAWTLKDLSAAELHSVLLHELGHLRRWDDWTNLAQKVLKALLFFHPAVWWIDSRLALEREIACDDLVLAQTSDAQGYAKCLVSIAEKTLGRRAFAFAVAAVGRFKQTAARLTRILDQNRLSGTRVSKPALACATVLASALAVGLPRVPSLIVFGDTRPVAKTMPVIPDLAANPAKPVAELIPASVRSVSEGNELSIVPTLKKAEFRTRIRRIEKRESTNKPRLSRVKANTNPKPMLVETSWTEQQAPTFLLMTQTVACDADGNCFISVRTWRVSTVLQVKPTQTQNGSSAKSI